MSMTTNDHADLVSHTETALGESKPQRAFKAVRPFLIDIQRISNPKKIEAALKDFIEETDSKPQTRIAARATGSLLAGLKDERKPRDIALKIWGDGDHEALGDISDLLTGAIADGQENPWKAPAEALATVGPGCVPHLDQLRDALEKAKRGDLGPLYDPNTFSRVWLITNVGSAADLDELKRVKAEMAAAKISVVQWEDAITRYKLDDPEYVPEKGTGYVLTPINDPVTGKTLEVKVRITYETTLPSGKPDPRSRLNVQQFLEASRTDIWFDEFAKKTYIKRSGKGIATPLDDNSLLEWMYAMREAGLQIDKDPTSDALANLAYRNKRHPVREYLAGHEWDGVKRVDTWLSVYAGAKKTTLNRAYGRKFLIGAVRRIKQPGVKWRAMPIFEGEQNIGKSLVFKTLAVRPEWYTDSLELGVGPKEVIELTEGKWIVETAELSGMARRDVEHIKAMISRDADKARMAYGKFTTEVPRQFVMGGTTNPTEYLKDRTGNTRFWGIKVGKPNIKGLERDLDQLWAEAVVLEASGEPHWLDDPELQALAAKSVEAREEVSEIERRWINLLEGADGDAFIPSDELWKAVGLDEWAKRLQGHKTSMNFAAKRAGWHLARKRTGHGEREYGYVAKTADAESSIRTTYDSVNERFRPIPAASKRRNAKAQASQARA